MTRALAGTILAFAAVGVAGADNPRGRDEGKVVAEPKLEGKWGTNTYTDDGQECGEVMDSGEPYVVFTFMREGFIQRTGNQGRAGALRAYIVKGEGEITIGAWQGVLRFDGNDTLSMCLILRNDLTGRNDPLPTKFESKKGSRCWLYVLKRLNP
jgi:hypothetical protein